jgi:probable phosphoglycerate mutase
VSPSSRRAGRRLVVEADGGSRGNPGVAGYGAVVRDAATGTVLVELAEPLGRRSNNVAEYSGLIAGLSAAAEVDPGARVQVRMDSKLVVEQMSGRWKVRHDDMRRLATEAREICAAIESAGGSVSFDWVPRERNKTADALSNEAMDGKSVRRVHAATEPDGLAAGSAAGALPDGGPAPDPGAGPRPGSAATQLRLLLIQVPHDPGVTERVVPAVRRLVGGSARVVTSPDATAMHVGSGVAGALGVDVEAAPEWAGTAPGEAADETVETAYRRLVTTGGTVVVVTSRRGILSVLADVLGTPVDRFWAVATAPGSLTAVEVWEDGSASVAFTNRTEHLA